MAVPIDVASSPGGPAPEPTAAVSGKDIEGRSLGQIAWMRLRQDKQAAESGTARTLAQDPAAAGRGQLATRQGASGPAPVPSKAPAKGRKGRNADDDDDDLGEVADILRRHGIT